VEVDSAGLQVLAARCDTAAKAASVPSPLVSGPPDQAITVAVTESHQLVESVLAAFATSVTGTGSAVRAAAAVYTGTDAEAGQNLSAVGQSVGR
jgi:hypothetical protein